MAPDGPERPIIAGQCLPVARPVARVWAGRWWHCGFNWNRDGDERLSRAGRCRRQRVKSLRRQQDPGLGGWSGLLRPGERENSETSRVVALDRPQFSGVGDFRTRWV